MFLVLASAAAGSAQEPPAPAAAAARVARTWTVSRAASAIVVDGALDESAWSSATEIPVAYEWAPGDNSPARVATQCLVTFDSDNLYVAFRAADPDPAAIRAHLADRDVPAQDDTVGFFIDPFNDERRAFQFRVNALGVQMDATNTDVDGAENFSWDTLWDARGRIDATGYVVEIRVPFSSLRFPRAAGVQTWGFLAMRDYPRDNRYRMRSAPTDRNKDCVVCQFDKVTGLEGISPGRNIELDPTITAARSDARDDLDGPLVSGSEDVEAGLTARWGVTPNMTLNGAINPDFSQVEADSAQLDVNNRFALFFPEKRPFFLEGADVFATPLNAVFTRTVADPKVGLKLTGKEGVHALGVFLAQDRVNNLIFPSNQGSGFDSLDEEVTSGVVRYRRDIGKSSAIGGLYSGREGDDYHNHVFGVDGTLRLSDADTVRFQYLRSTTRYPRQLAVDNGQSVDSFDGDFATVRYDHRGREWTWNVRYDTLGAGFRADSGFVTRVDLRTGNAGVGRIFYGKEGGWFNRIELFMGADVNQNQDGTIREHGQDFVFVYAGPRQTFFELAVAPNREHFNGVDYDNFRQSVFFEMRPVGWMGFYLFGAFGETIDFANSRPARRRIYEPGVDFNIGRHLQGAVNATQSRLDVDGGELFDARLVQLRLLYHFNLRTYVRGIVQYTSIDRNPALYLAPVNPTTERVFSQFLFSYKLNPQTVFLFGYADNYLGLEGIDRTQTDRSFFLKIGYAWVL